MIWSSVRRTLVTELYSWPVLALLLAILASIGLSFIGHSAFARAALGIAVAMVIYRIRYRRW